MTSHLTIAFVLQVGDAAAAGERVLLSADEPDRLSGRNSPTSFLRRNLSSVRIHLKLRVVDTAFNVDVSFYFTGR